MVTNSVLYLIINILPLEYTEYWYHHIHHNHQRSSSLSSSSCSLGSIIGATTTLEKNGVQGSTRSPGSGWRDRRLFRWSLWHKDNQDDQDNDNNNNNRWAWSSWLAVSPSGRCKGSSELRRNPPQKTATGGNDDHRENVIHNRFFATPISSLLRFFATPIFSSLIFLCNTHFFFVDISLQHPFSLRIDFLQHPFSLRRYFLQHPFSLCWDFLQHPFSLRRLSLSQGPCLCSFLSISELKIISKWLSSLKYSHWASVSFLHIEFKHVLLSPSFKGEHGLLSTGLAARKRGVCQFFPTFDPISPSLKIPRCFVSYTT